MTFERSPLGQANRAIFYNVDWIIYTEGGDGEEDNARSFDALFWSGTFRTICRESSFRAIPRGGKAQLRPLADSVVRGELDHVIVAMDRDYDAVTDSLLDHERVVYTFGYSFENDIFPEQYLYDIFDSMSPEVLDRSTVEPLIVGWTGAFYRRARWPIKMDFLAKQHAIAGFDRDKPQKYMSSNAYGAEPELCGDRIAAEVVRISGACKEVFRPGFGNPKLDLKDVYGHLWEVFSYRLMACLHSRYSRTPKPTYEGLRAIAIQHFQIKLALNQQDDPLISYYREQVQAAVLV